jgi:hypothetical protein
MVREQIQVLVDAEFSKSKDYDFDNNSLSNKINEFLGIELINDHIQKEDISAMKDPLVV